MNLTVLKSNEGLMIKWFEEYSGLSIEVYSVFLNIINSVQRDMTIFYQMNEMLDKDEREYKYSKEEIEISFYKKDESYVLESSFGHVLLDYYAFKTIISKVIDIYSETYPLGTVVELDKDLFNDILEIEEDEALQVVILDRFTPITETLCFYYTGAIYPTGNHGDEVSCIHFAPNMINKVVHMGYSDNEETEFIEAKKKELLIGRGMHSITITTKEEQEVIRQGV